MNDSYYFAICLSTGRAIITKSKRAIAKHLNISESTVDRRLQEIHDKDIVYCKDYIISKRIEVHKQKKGGGQSLKRIRYEELLKKSLKMASDQLDYERYQQ